VLIIKHSKFLWRPINVIVVPETGIEPERLLFTKAAEFKLLIKKTAKTKNHTFLTQKACKSF
jgi:hypothetical protein